jgi:hypothetical protein
MQNQIELILRSGSSVTTEYTYTFNDCPQTTEIECSIVTIYLGYGGTLSPTPANPDDVWSQLANENGIITLYDAYDVETGTLTINSYVPTSQKLFFDSDANCASIVADACYFKFSLTVSDLKEYYLDLYPNESISLSYQFTDLNNFSQIGTFSRDFRIPASKKNVEALGPLYDYNFVDDVQSFSRKYTCELRVDTIPISRGYLRVMAAYKQADFLSDFQVAFYSEAPNFVKAIGEKKLADITDLTTKNENVVLPNVTTQNSFRIWSLIDRATGSKAFSELGEANTISVYNENAFLFAGHLTPCVRADYLLTEIFNDAGYQLDATALLNIIQDYYVPWINNVTLVSTQGIGDLALRVTRDVSMTQGYVTWQLFPMNDDSSIGFFDNQSAFDLATSKYTAPISGIYTFKLQTNINMSSIYRVRFAFDKTIVSTGNSYQINIGDIDNGGSGMNNSGIYSWTTEPIFLRAGDTLELIYRVSNGGVGSITFNAYGTILELVNVEQLGNMDIYYPANAPDVKQIDFVSDIIKMHNLAIVTDASIENKLKLEPMTTFIGSGTILDWSKKLDISKDIVIKGTDDLRKSKLNFTYSAGQDFYSKLFVDQGRIYGDYTPEPYLVTATQQPSEFAQGETTVKLVAQSTPATQINGTNYIVPRFWTQSGQDAPKFVAPGLRFLYYAENVDVRIYDETTSSLVIQSVPTLNHYSDTSGFNPDYNNLDLNWAPETPLHEYTANPFSNLFTLYWRDYLDTIYSDDARMLEASFALDNTDILTLNFADYIFVKDAYWRVIELSDYKMGQYESTRVKLLKMNPGAEPTPGCDIVPVSVNPDGTVQFETPGGSPVAASETCCKAFNYTWSEDTNLCYARPSDRPSVGKPNNDAANKGEITSINTISSGSNNIISTTGLNAGTSTFSVYSGNNIIVENQNDNLIAVGDTIKLVGEHRGAAMFGKAVEKYVPGFAVGGGYPLDDATYKSGAQQAGLTILSGQGNFVASPAALGLTLEGIAAKYIELENDTLWFCEISVILTNAAFANHYAKATCNIWKNGAGVAFVGGIATQFEAGNLGAGGALTVVCDVATNPAQHRFGLQFAWAGAPIPGVRAAIQIKYTQLR